MSSGSKGWRRVNKDWLIARLADGDTNFDMARELGVPREYIRDARRAYGLSPERIDRAPQANVGPLAPALQKPRAVEWPAGMSFLDDPRAQRPEGRFIGVRAETFTGYRESMS